MISRLTPPPDYRVSEWCDSFRRLDGKYSAEPGRWRTARVPYLREVMDSFVDPTVGSIIFIKASRVGGTELMYNLLLYSADHRPMPTLFVMPKESDVDDEFKGRLRASILSSPRSRRHAVSSQWCQSDIVNLDTMTIWGAWASSPDTLIRRTCGVVMFDEVDNCESQAGRLGQTWTLAAERLATYKHRGKQVGVTTPTVVDAAGWKAWLASDQRRYHVPCPYCGFYQVLVLGSLEWPSDATPDEVELDSLAKYKCGSCGNLIRQSRQKWMVDRGVWVPSGSTLMEVLDVEDEQQVADAVTGQFRPTWDPDPVKTRRRGYWINAFYSPWRTWSQIASKYRRCKKDPEEYRVFKNAWLAEPWEHSVQAPDESWLTPKVLGAKRKEAVVPAGARVILVGMDVQLDRIYWVARAFGAGGRSWLLEAGVSDTLQEVYDRTMVKGWSLEHDPSSVMLAFAQAVDAGYRADEVYAYADNPGVNAVRGYETLTKPVEQTSVGVKWTDGRPAGRRVVWKVNTLHFKNRLARLMKTTDDRDGSWMLHSQVSPEYLAHMTAEHFVRVGASRKWSWRLKVEGRPNHWWDCEVYVLGLAEMLVQVGELDVSDLTDQSVRKRVRGRAVENVGSGPGRRKVTGGWADR